MSDPRPEPAFEPTPLEHAPSPSSRGPSTLAALVAEFLGTFLLVLGGVGSAVFAATFGLSENGTPLGIGFAGVSLAFGLTVVAGAYAFGPISGGHFNPAVTLGLAAAGRFPWRGTIGYIVAQILGGAVATSIIALIGSSAEGWFDSAREGGFASNGWGELSPGGFGIGGAIGVEIVFTAVFLFVILGVTHRTRGNPLIAGLVIGLTLTLIHLVTIPVDNTSVNPARSIAAAIYGGAEPLAQLWVFIVFPIIGALAAGVLHRLIFDRQGD
ncbi:aquaporin Z [Salinibacterium sp. dk2585]|uniref:aquaporin Z n=1 Tax=unclassified Salinibacterium TaxID=2632331 RepID=UPI0011C247D7|nr:MULTISPECIES: aquaporin Z [unclassified Salinibacterium]QEE60254.1 aquaporin Z [Salinibacterium sp. dk2585]TXK55326.1 aquaporin Z [Salinibacterium sp. dk5596]